jgi:hypothetical protein
MDSIIHLSSELYIYILFSLKCAYTYEIWSCESVLRICFLPQLSTPSRIYLWANLESWASSCVWFAGQWCVPGAHNGLPHWQHACRLPLGSDGASLCNPELQLPSFWPCSRAATADHNFDLLFLRLAMFLGCYSRPSCASWLAVGLACTRFRLPYLLDSLRHTATIRWASRVPFSLFYVLCPSGHSVSVLRVCAMWFVILQIYLM